MNKIQGKSNYAFYPKENENVLNPHQKSFEKNRI